MSYDTFTILLKMNISQAIIHE